MNVTSPKTILFFSLIAVITLSFGSTPFVDGEHRQSGVVYPSITTFTINGFVIITDNPHVSEIILDWDNPQLPRGEILLDDAINGTITIQIPKSMPRTINLDFGSTLGSIRDQRTNIISESESECYYLVSFKFENNDHIEFGSLSVAAGRWEPVSVLDQACDDIYNNLKQSPTKDNSLKQQIVDYISKERIECPNIEHVLVERPNKKLACIEHHTLNNLDWKIFNLSDTYVKSTYKIEHEKRTISVEYVIKNGIVTDMQTDGHGSGLFVNLVASKKGTLDITLPSITITPGSSNCAKSGFIHNDFMVLTYGEEIDFNTGMMNTEYPTISIPFDMGVSQLEIVSICLI